MNEAKLRKKIDQIFDNCYSIDGSVCPLHTVFKPGKACNELIILIKAILKKEETDGTEKG